MNIKVTKRSGKIVELNLEKWQVVPEKDTYKPHNLGISPLAINPRLYDLGWGIVNKVVAGGGSPTLETSL